MHPKIRAKRIIPQKQGLVVWEFEDFTFKFNFFLEF